jgi:hypothetical protein
VVELQSIELQKISEEKRWGHTETPLHVKFEHYDLGGVRKRHWGLEVSPPSGFSLRSHSALAFHGLDVRILNMGFLPIPMKVLRDLLFLVLSIFLLSIPIRFLIRRIVWVCTRHFFFSFGQVVLWVQIRHLRTLSLD